MTYVVETMVLGELAQEEVTAVRMLRARFMEVVEGELEDYPDLRDELLPVAQSMPRFPMATWIDERRGCGCVVGEYLIATSELDRAGVTRRLEVSGISALLDELENGRRLIDFGERVDDALRNEIGTRGAEVIVIEDEQEDATNV